MVASPRSRSGTGSMGKIAADWVRTYLSVGLGTNSVRQNLVRGIALRNILIEYLTNIRSLASSGSSD
jgi:hypothetical protein